MTSLESLVPPLASCERLKEAGFPQGDSAFSWVFHNRDGTWELWITAGWTGRRHPTEVAAAPTFEAIWRRLPERLNIEGRLSFFCMAKTEDPEIMLLWYEDSPNQRVKASTFMDTPAVAAAELWLWCAENGHLEGAEDD